MVPSEQIAQKLREIRKERGYTLAEVAEAIGVSTKTMSSWERCTRRPNADALVKLCHFLDCQITDFYGVNGEEGIQLTKEEMWIIEDFRALTPNRRAGIRQLLEDAADASERERAAADDL